MNDKSSTTDAVFTDKTTVKCEGGSGALGHPAIYLSLEKAGQVVCPYCSKKFVFNGQPSSHS